MSRRPALFTQADLARAIRAIAQSDVKMMLEVLPNGTMRISPALPQADVGAPKEPERVITL